MIPVSRLQIAVVAMIGTIVAAISIGGCIEGGSAMEMKNKAAAEKFFIGVYGGDPDVVEQLAADSIMVSYPIFKKIFGTSVLRGREAVKKLATGFSRRWAETEVTVDDAVAEGNKVVLVWSFSGRNVGSVDPDVQPTGEVSSWGGITLFTFDESGKITTEIGEESEPGPFGRLSD